MKRITPLNILMSMLLIWIGFGLIDKTLSWAQAFWVLLLIVMTAVCDQLFRVYLSSLKRIWIVQLLFIVITIGAAFTIWYIKNK